MLLNYLKDKLKTILLFLLFTLVFAIVFYLHRLPLNAVLYGFLLCILAALGLFTFDFYSYGKRHKALLQLQNNILVCVEQLPKVKGLIETDYARLLAQFQEAYRGLVSQTDTKQTEMLDFYTLWVHQIKTPISAISLLLQENQSQEKAFLLQELFKIERYVELVLGYLRLDTISSDLALGQYQLAEIIKQAVKKYAPIFIHQKIKLEMPDLQATVLTDEKWLVFVIEQILSNALKYTHQGTIKIYLEANKILIIEDTGIGICPEDLPRLFEKGFTGFNGRMDKKSTGLGLYLCKKTLGKLHHNIEITSKQGVGTAVSIDLSSVDMMHE